MGDVIYVQFRDSDFETDTLTEDETGIIDEEGNFFAHDHYSLAIASSGDLTIHLYNLAPDDEPYGEITFMMSSKIAQEILQHMLCLMSENPTNHPKGE